MTFPHKVCLFNTTPIGSPLAELFARKLKYINLAFFIILWLLKFSQVTGSQTFVCDPGMENDGIILSMINYFTLFIIYYFSGFDRFTN